jgi:predicted Zn finger-like uncharacterized protein
LVLHLRAESLGSVFTQCSNCETVFKLSADVLRAASGQVRCGNCGEVFNALARLAEDANAFAVSESSYELESRADDILRAPAPPHSTPDADESEDFGPPGVEIARLQILDWNEADAAQPTTEDLSQDPDEPVSDPSMEFTLPPGELDRIFVESKKRQAATTSGAPPIVTPPRAASPPSPPAPAAATPAPVPEDPEEFEVDIDPVPIRIKPLTTAPAPNATPQAKAATSPVAPAPRAAQPASAVPTPAPSKPATPPAPPKVRAPVVTPAAPPVPAAEEPPPHPESVAASSAPFDVPDAVRFEILSSMESSQPLHELTRSTRPPGLRRWVAAALAFGLLLSLQIVHHNREYLASHGPFAGLLRALYAGAGAPVPSAANLSAYQLRQWGVTGDPAADGTLRVRASILNGAAQLEIFPLLRVTLANRFGSRIGARDFEPSEYLGKPTARYMNPGEQVDATMDILDPGKSAEGFEIDVCLRGADRKISCANDATPAQNKR